MREARPGLLRSAPWVLADQMAFLDRFQRLVTRHDDALAFVRVGDEDPGGFPADGVWADIVRLYETGLHPAIGLCVLYRGRPVLHRTIGHLLNRPDTDDVGDVVTPDTLFSMFSASKIVSAMLLHSLVEEGAVRLDERMVEYLPELVSRGKEAIRIRHLLNHTAGIPDMPRGMDIERAIEAGRIDFRELDALRPSHPPGTYAAYAPMTNWVLLAEVARRVTGHDLRTELSRRFLEPLGFDHLSYGVRPEDRGRVARHAVTGLPVPGVMSGIFERTIGVPFERAVELSNGEKFMSAVLPSVNVTGTILEMTRFMQMLLNGGRLGDTQVMSSRTIRRAVTEVTPRQFDGTFGFPMRYGLGPMMGGTRFSLFGLGTRGAFGHLGLSAVVVYADPRRHLAVSFLNTGKTMAAPGMLQWAWCLQRIIQAASKPGLR